MADAFGDVLVEGDRVAKSAAARVRRRGEKADIRRMPGIHVGMRDTAEDGEIIPMLAQQIEVRRRRVTPPRLLGKELIRKEPEVVADGEDAPRLRPRPSCRSRFR